MEQKTFYFKGYVSDISDNINNLISEGWIIKNIAPMGPYGMLQYASIVLCERKKKRRFWKR